jgi:hypothetical protein
MVLGIPFWRRHELSRIVMRHFGRWVQYARERPELDVEIKLVAVVTCEHDAASAAYATEAGWTVVDCPNKPLGRKFNATARAAKDLDADALLLMGSDNFISPKAFEVFARAIDKYRALGVQHCHFINSDTGHAVRWHYGLDHHRYKEPIGPARLINRDALEAVDWAPWDPSAFRGVDRTQTEKLMEQGIAWVLVPDDLTLIDVKTRESLNPFTPFIPAGVPVDLGKVLSAIPAEDAEEFRRTFPLGRGRT